MGYWSMVVHGHGIHNNGRPDDADSLLHEFVTRLKGSGHQVHHATITTGAIEGVPGLGEADSAQTGYASVAAPKAAAEVPAEASAPDPAGTS